MENTYNKLRALNVNEHTEKKGQLTYLSWAWAVDVLLQQDSAATWEFPEPRTLPDNTVMVFCKVTAFGKTLPMQLPVMDNRNMAIKNPDARKISDATMRCLAKCIACFGIGLYIYAGEDLPDNDEPVKKDDKPTPKPEPKKPISAGKQFFDKYFDELSKVKTPDDYNLAVVSNKESVQKFLVTYVPDVRLATEAEIAKREQAAKVRVGA